MSDPPATLWLVKGGSQMGYQRGISKAEYWAMRGESYFSKPVKSVSVSEEMVNDYSDEYFECRRGHMRCSRCK